MEKAEKEEKQQEESALYWTRTSDPRPVKAML